MFHLPQKSYLREVSAELGLCVRVLPASAWVQGGSWSCRAEPGGLFYEWVLAPMGSMDAYPCPVGHTQWCQDPTAPSFSYSLKSQEEF